MIQISGMLIDPVIIKDQLEPYSIESEIVDILASSPAVYQYNSDKQLIFELQARRSIIKASRDLNRSYFAFKVFKKSTCNPDYWQRNNEGGFLLELGINPSDAIKDIYINSRMYGTECATAIVIVYYKALVDILPEELFNQLFPDIYLMNWLHLDRDLGIYDYPNVADILPGDGMYFKNPDVDPETPEWQGENVFVLGDGTYYGHGIGISDAEGIIRELNKRRFEDSNVSAYLMDSAKRLNFKSLANKYLAWQGLE